MSPAWASICALKYKSNGFAGLSGADENTLEDTPVVVDVVEVELVIDVVVSVVSFDVVNEMVEELIALELDEVEVVDTVAISEIVMFR